MIKELDAGEQKTIAEMVAGFKKCKPEAKFVGYQLHFVVEFEGQEVLASIGGYSEGFNKDDYE